MAAARQSSRAGVAWTQLRARLETLPHDDLVRVVRTLYDRSVENRRFLAATLLGSDAATALADYCAHIQRQFAVSDPPRSPRLGAARKAIRDYAKATGDVAGTAELMLAYLEAGNAFGRDQGDMPVAYYEGLAVVLRDLGEAIRDTPSLYAALEPRLARLRNDSKRVGWDWGGTVAEVVDRLEADLARD